jgi:hypothetical protein
MPSLTRFIGVDNSVKITWDAFQTLAETAGGSLVELTGIRITEGASSKRVSPSVFRHFTALRSFT